MNICVQLVVVVIGGVVLAVFDEVVASPHSLVKVILEGHKVIGVAVVLEFSPSPCFSETLKLRSEGKPFQEEFVIVGLTICSDILLQDGVVLVVPGVFVAIWIDTVLYVVDLAFLVLSVVFIILIQVLLVSIESLILNLLEVELDGELGVGLHLVEVGGVILAHNQDVICDIVPLIRLE